MAMVRMCRQLDSKPRAKKLRIRWKTEEISGISYSGDFSKVLFQPLWDRAGNKLKGRGEGIRA